MRQEPDNYEPIHYRNREGEPLRLVALIVLVVCFCLTGCTYTRNAPLFTAPLINATGNTTTVPLVP